jgi:hypothetical protein
VNFLSKIMRHFAKKKNEILPTPTFVEKCSQMVRQHPQFMGLPQC